MSRGARRARRGAATPRRRGLVVAACALVAGGGALAGCGGSDKSADSAALTPSTNQNGQPDRIIVGASNGRFSPEAVYRRAAPGVVTVISVFRGGVSLFGDPGSGGLGSGFVINENGEIATNAHVVTDGTGANIRPAQKVFVEFADRNRVPAEIKGFDPQADVALLKVDPDGIDMVPLELADGRGISVGQPVAAIGSPFGEVQSLSVGVVSATDRAIQSLTDFQIDNAIQTDASINPGNSGGPLLDAEGRVIGINQQIETRSGSNAGVGFAVPVTLVSRSIDQLRQNGKAEYAYLGVSSQPLYPQLADHLGIDSPTGALIAEVVPGGPADDAGLKGGDKNTRFQGAQVKVGGDVIVAVEGKKLVDASDLAERVAEFQPGDRITLEVIRDGQQREIEVELGKRPLGTPQ